MMLTLNFGPGSSSMAPHIALYEIGVPFDARPVSFARKDQRQPAFRALNPDGKVPVLVDEGRVLTEVAAILYHLARRNPTARLWPEGDLEAEAQVISWMSFVASTLHPARTKGAGLAHEAYLIAERRLGGRDWAVGGYSIADIHLFRLYWRYFNSLKPDPSAFPGLHAHYARMLARPAVERTLAAEQAVGYELPA